MAIDIKKKFQKAIRRMGIGEGDVDNFLGILSFVRPADQERIIGFLYRIDEADDSDSLLRIYREIDKNFQIVKIRALWKALLVATITSDLATFEVIFKETERHKGCPHYSLIQLEVVWQMAKFVE